MMKIQSSSMTRHHHTIPTCIIKGGNGMEPNPKIRVDVVGGASSSCCTTGPQVDPQQGEDHQLHCDPIPQHDLPHVGEGTILTTTTTPPPPPPSSSSS